MKSPTIFLLSAEDMPEEERLEFEIEMIDEVEKTMTFNILRHPVQISNEHTFFISAAFAPQNQSYSFSVESEDGHVFSVFGFKSTPEEPCILYTAPNGHALQFSINI